MFIILFFFIILLFFFWYQYINKFNNIKKDYISIYNLFIYIIKDYLAIKYKLIEITNPIHYFYSIYYDNLFRFLKDIILLVLFISPWIFLFKIFFFIYFKCIIYFFLILDIIFIDLINKFIKIEKYYNLIKKNILFFLLNLWIKYLPNKIHKFKEYFFLLNIFNRFIKRWTKRIKYILIFWYKIKRIFNLTKILFAELNIKKKKVSNNFINIKLYLILLFDKIINILNLFYIYINLIIKYINLWGKIIIILKINKIIKKFIYNLRYCKRKLYINFKWYKQLTYIIIFKIFKYNNFFQIKYNNIIIFLYFVYNYITTKKIIIFYKYNNFFSCYYNYISFLILLNINIFKYKYIYIQYIYIYIQYIYIKIYIYIYI